MFFSCIIYVFLITISFGMPNSYSETVFIKKFINLSTLIEQKAIYISQNLLEENLALNYLGNVRKLSFYEAIIFQNSGLMHLLAISGAQVVPLAQFVSTFIGSTLYLILNIKIKPHCLMILINQIKNINSLVIAFIICSLFGCSGALIRVVGLNYFSKIYFIKQQYTIFFKFFPYILSNTFIRLIVLSFMLFYFGNIFINFSFLLSAIGATSAEFSLRVSKKLVNKKNLIIQSISSTILTSLVIGIILFPFSETNIYNSCLANILASPIVCLLITPLSLSALILPDTIFFYDYIILNLDYSLFLLKKIALYFNNNNLIDPYKNSNILFTNIGVFYLNFILILLWLLSDFLKEKKMTLFKNKFLSS